MNRQEKDDRRKVEAFQNDRIGVEKKKKVEEPFHMTALFFFFSHCPSSIVFQSYLSFHFSSLHFLPQAKKKKQNLKNCWKLLRNNLLLRFIYTLGLLYFFFFPFVAVAIGVVFFLFCSFSKNVNFLCRIH